MFHDKRTKKTDGMKKPAACDHHLRTYKKNAGKILNKRLQRQYVQGYSKDAEGGENRGGRRLLQLFSVSSRRNGLLKFFDLKRKTEVAILGCSMSYEKD